MLLKYFNVHAEENSDSELIEYLWLVPPYLIANQTAFQTSYSSIKSWSPLKEIAMGQITTTGCGAFAAPGL